MMKLKYRSLNKLADFKKEDWTKILHLFNDSCAYCGTKEDISIDHIIPVSKGGTSDKNNLLPACKTCNRKKSNKDLSVFCSKEKIKEREYILSH